MKSQWIRIVVSCLMILIIVAALGLSCGKGGGEGKRTIVIGHLSDMTGPASAALIPINYALEDLVRYYNEQGLIPGVELKVVTYDGRYDPSRDIPGYEWVKGKGAVAITTGLPPIGVTLKPFAKRDKIPIFPLTTSTPQLDPPGWVFCMNATGGALIDTLLEWIPGNDPDYPTGRPAKIGSVGWDEAYAQDLRNAIKDYAQAHSDKYDWVGGYLAPVGVTSWSGEMEKVKDCDYLFPPSTGTGTTTFMRDFRDRGYRAKYIGTDAQAAYRGLIEDTCSWDDIDGTLLSFPTRWYNDTNPVISLAKQFLTEWHAGQGEKIIHAGGGYIGSFQQNYGMLQILAKAINDVGVENFNGQVLYDTATNFSVKWEGYEEWGFSATKRYSWNYTAIYEWSKEAQDLVRKVPEWLPLVME